MSAWPTSVATDANLSIASNSLQTTLGSGIGSTDVTIPLASTTGFPTAGYVTIDNEVVSYTGVSGGNLTGCTRGADGTSAATHTTGAAVSATIVAAHHNSLKDEVKAIETTLSGITGLNPTLPLAVSQAMATDANGHIAAATTTVGELQGLHALTISRALATNASGIVTPSATTAAELAFVSGVTSALQTQLNAKASTDLSNVASVAANVPMNSKKFTGMAAGAAAGESVRFEQLKVLQWAFSTTVSGLSTTSGTFANAGATVTLTPTNATTTFLIWVMGPASSNGASNVGVLGISGTTTGDLYTVGSCPCRFAGTQAAQVAICFGKDTPGSALAQTYTGRLAAVAGTITIGNSTATGAQTSILVLEVA